MNYTTENVCYLLPQQGIYEVAGDYILLTLIYLEKCILKKKKCELAIVKYLQAK